MKKYTFKGMLVDYPLLRILPFTYEPAATMQLRNEDGEIMDVLVKGELADNFLMKINMEVTYTVSGMLGPGYDQSLTIVDYGKSLLVADSINK